MNLLTTTYKRPHLFLACGLLCYSITVILSLWEERITSSTPYTQLSLSLELLAEYLWSVPSALFIFSILIFILWGYYRARTRGIRYLKGFAHPGLPALLKWCLLLPLLIYSVVPLRWAQLSLTRSPESFPDYTPFDAVLLLLTLGGTILLCLYCFTSLPSGVVSLIEKVTNRMYKVRERPFLGILLILCLTLTGVIAYVVLDHIPHILDSIAQLFQAKIFTTGKLYAPIPPHKEFFDYAHVINDEKWYSQYPPGHALLLSIGLLLGAPWLIGPLTGTASLLIFYLVVKGIYHDKRLTYLSTLLFLCSPFFLFMSSSHMNHTSTMFFIVLFLLFYSGTVLSPSLTAPLLAGLSLGYAINIRPLTAVAIGLPFMLHLLIRTCWTKEVQSKKAVVFFTGISFMVLVLLLYNYFTNGNPFVFGYQQKYSTLGFLGNTQGWTPQPHTLKGGVINTSNNLIGLNEYLFEWPIPSLTFVFLLFFLPLKKCKWDFLFLSASLVLTISYFFYFHQDYIFGPRFYYCLTPFLIIFTVRAFLALPPWLETKHFDKRRTEATLSLLLLICVTCAVLFSVPSLIKKYSSDYWWVTSKLHNTVKEQGITNAIIFVDCWHPPDIPQPNLIYYGSGFQYNSPNLHDDVIYALDLKEKNRELIRAFPGRNYYYCPFFWDRRTVAW